MEVILYMDNIKEIDRSLIARRLYELLYNRGLFQKDLAEMSGIPPETISKYLNGKQMPDTKRLFALAQALGVSTDYILGLERDVIDNLEGIRKDLAYERTPATERAAEKVEKIMEYYSGARY